MSTVVVKIGTSSITDAHGAIDTTAVAKLVNEVAKVRADGHRVVVVTSGAISAGLPRICLHEPRPKDLPTLQAVAAIGQSRLMRVYDDAFWAHDIVCGQVLLAPLDFDRGRHEAAARRDRRADVAGPRSARRILRRGAVGRRWRPGGVGDRSPLAPLRRHRSLAGTPSAPSRIAAAAAWMARRIFG